MCDKTPTDSSLREASGGRAPARRGANNDVAVECHFLCFDSAAVIPGDQRDLHLYSLFTVANDTTSLREVVSFAFVRIILHTLQSGRASAAVTL